ncbi:uncharacterized protein LOC142768235 [Rhipicephalus microplus]|uniref:uncharacterized protein LOC142768235 n=1 Tax=Rhipicephalus microplus TaxID=6941 RepID=UPI003F6C0BAC
MGDESQMSQMSAVSESSQMSSTAQPGAATASDRMARRQNKRMIVRAGVVIIILLLIIDIILLYIWLTSEPTVIHEKATVVVDDAGIFQPSDLDPRDTDDSLLVLEELSFPGTDTTSEHRHRHGVCNSTGCLWLQHYLSPGGRMSSSGHIHSQSQKGGRPGPCDDFYEHVCGSRRHSLYRDGVARLMVAVAERITGRLRAVAGSGSVRVHAADTGDPDEDHAIVLERCLKGGAMVTKNMILRPCGEPRSQDCPPSLPDAPLGISERFFVANSSATIEDYAAFLQSVAPKLHTGGHLSVDDVGMVKTFPRRWITRACRWVELSARCHLERNPQLRGYGRLSLYKQLWKLIYFAPFMGSPARPLVKVAYQEPPDPQLQACLRVMHDAFRQKAAEAAKATLSEAVDELHDTVIHFVWEARQVMRSLVPEWLAQAAINRTHGDKYDAKERRLARQQAAQQLVAIEALVDDGSGSTDADVGVYSWQVRYSEDRKALVLPLGLLGLFIDSMATIEPVLVPALGRPVLRQLMPVRHGPYSWRRHNEQRLGAIVDCVASVLDEAGIGQGELLLNVIAARSLMSAHCFHRTGHRVHNDAV